MATPNVGMFTCRQLFEDEVSRYMAHMPSPSESESPLLFWKNHGHMYPKLSILAKEYLGIPCAMQCSCGMHVQYCRINYER